VKPETRKLPGFLVTVLTLGVTMTMVKADTYQSGRDADIMRERGQV